MLQEFNPATMSDMANIPQEKLKLVYDQLRFWGEVHCKLYDDRIDLRGHTIEYFDGFMWVDNLYKSKFTLNYFNEMVGDIWRLCK